MRWCRGLRWLACMLLGLTLGGTPRLGAVVVDDGLPPGGLGPGTLVAAVLPSSRAVQVGQPATAFATLINSGPGTATGCGLAPLTTLPATWTYQTTARATNALTGTVNT